MDSNSSLFRELYDLQANYMCDAKRWYNNPDPAWKYLHKRRFELAAKILSRISLPNTLTLDVGCGEGLYSSIITGGYVGVDLSIIRLRRAKINYHNHGVEFVLADILHLPFRSNSFDCIFASEIIEHVTNINSVINIFNSLLKNNAFLFLTTPQKTSIVESETFCIRFIRTILNLSNFLKIENMLLSSSESTTPQYPPKLLQFEQNFEHLNVLNFEEIISVLKKHQFIIKLNCFCGFYFGSCTHFASERLREKFELFLKRTKIGRSLFWTMFILSRKNEIGVQQ